MLRRKENRIDEHGQKLVDYFAYEYLDIVQKPEHVGLWIVHFEDYKEVYYTNNEYLSRSMLASWLKDTDSPYLSIQYFKLTSEAQCEAFQSLAHHCYSHSDKHREPLTTYDLF